MDVYNEILDCLEEYGWNVYLRGEFGEMKQEEIDEMFLGLAFFNYNWVERLWMRFFRTYPFWNKHPTRSKSFMEKLYYENRERDHDCVRRGPVGEIKKGYRYFVYPVTNDPRDPDEVEDADIKFFRESVIEYMGTQVPISDFKVRPEGHIQIDTFRMAIDEEDPRNSRLGTLDPIFIHPKKFLEILRNSDYMNLREKSGISDR